MLPNDHHPGPRCSCGDCLREYPSDLALENAQLRQRNTHQGEVKMTTTVKVLIEGNKACEVKVEGNEGDSPVTVKPGQFTTKQIHGEQRVSVVEVGEFL